MALSFLPVPDEVEDSVIIKKIETFNSGQIGVVCLTIDTGLQGWGQFAPYDADITTEVFHRHVAPHAIGRPADDIEALVQLVEDKGLKFPGSYLRRATTGLDTALWDLQGKVEQKPVTVLLGGRPGKMPIYGSSMRRNISAQDEALRFCRLRDELGVTAFKWRVGDNAGRDRDRWPGRSEEMIRVVSRALGDDIGKLIDANSGFYPARAIEVGKLAEDHGITHFEEPCLWWEYEQTKQVTDALQIDVTGGEQDCEISMFQTITSQRVVDVVQPDVMYLGGISRTLRVAKLTQEAGLPITPHAANLSLVTMCTLHLLLALPNRGKYLEYSIEQAPFERELFEGNPFRIENGHVSVSEEPGWGVNYSRAFLERAVHRVLEED